MGRKPEELSSRGRPIDLLPRREIHQLLPTSQRNCVVLAMTTMAMEAVAMTVTMVMAMTVAIAKRLLACRLGSCQHDAASGHRLPGLADGSDMDDGCDMDDDGCDAVTPTFSPNELTLTAIPST